MKRLLITTGVVAAVLTGLATDFLLPGAQGPITSLVCAALGGLFAPLLIRYTKRDLTWIGGWLCALPALGTIIGLASPFLMPIGAALWLFTIAPLVAFFGTYYTKSNHPSQTA